MVRRETKVVRCNHFRCNGTQECWVLLREPQDSENSTRESLAVNLVWRDSDMHEHAFTLLLKRSRASQPMRANPREPQERNARTVGHLTLCCNTDDKTLSKNNATQYQRRNGLKTHEKIRNEGRVHNRCPNSESQHTKYAQAGPEFVNQTATGKHATKCPKCSRQHNETHIQQYNSRYRVRLGHSSCLSPPACVLFARGLHLFSVLALSVGQWAESKRRSQRFGACTLLAANPQHETCMKPCWQPSCEETKVETS